MVSSFDCWTCSFCGIGDFVWGPPIPAARGGGLPPPFGSLREGSWHTAGVTEGFLSYHGKSPVTAPPCHPLSRKGALRRRAGPSRPTRRGIRGGEGFRRLRAAGPFAHGGKGTKAPPGVGPGGQGPTGALPPDPRFTGDALLGVLGEDPAPEIRWIAGPPSGPLGPGRPKLIAPPSLRPRLAVRIPAAAG